MSTPKKPDKDPEKDKDEKKEPADPKPTQKKTSAAKKKGKSRVPEFVTCGLPKPDEGPSTSSASPRRPLMGKYKPRVSSPPRRPPPPPAPFTPSSSSSPEKQPIDYPAIEDLPLPPIPDKPASPLSLPDQRRRYEKPPVEKGGDNDSSSPGEACALPPEQYKQIAEKARRSRQKRDSTRSHARGKDEGSTSSPDLPKRKPEKEEKPKSRRSRDTRGRREAIRATMMRKRKEMEHALAETLTGLGCFDPYSNATASNYIIRRSTGIVYDSEITKHRCEWDERHPEEPQRVTTIMHKCYERGLLDKCVRISNFLRTDLYDRILTKHSAEHYEKLKTLCQTSNLSTLEREAAQYNSIYFNRFTFDAACRSLSSVLNLVLAIGKHEVMNGMAIVRPPGHHAMYNEFNGYCFFNNVAIAAEASIKDGLSKRVLIVDIDVHHGQGTQQMFYDRKDVLYFSVHRYEHGCFWPNLPHGNFNYIGKGEGLGYNINVPLNATNLRDDDYLAIVFSLLLPVAYEFNPDLVILSAGYDAVMGCPEGKMQVTPGFYSHLVALLHGLARGKMAVVLEGGYFIPTLTEAACLTLKTLLGGPCPALDPIRGVHPTVIETIRNVRRTLYGKWNCFSICEFVVPKAGVAKDENDIYKIQYFGVPEKAPFLTRNCYPENSIPEHNYYVRMNKALRERYRASLTLPFTYIYDEKMLKHKPQKGDVERPEKPDRLTTILETFKDFGVDKRLVRTKIVKRDWANYSPHIPRYMAAINAALLQTTDLYVNEHTNEAVDTAVCGILTILDGVMTGTTRGGVALIRPPGHHAEANTPLGFCFVNNIGVAATYLSIKYNMQRILIVDFDIQHGNGTQNMFYSNPHVLYISIHRDEKVGEDNIFYPTCPHSFKNDGHGAGRGLNINIPFKRDVMGDTEYISAFQNIVLPAAYAFAPQVVLVSAGFGAGIYEEKSGGYNVNPETFGHLILMLKPLAEGRVILILEGGFNVITTSLCMTICTKALLGDPIIMPKNVYKTFSESAIRTIRSVMDHLKKHFNIFHINTKLPHTAVVVKKVDIFTEETYSKTLTRTLDPDKVDDNAYVENEMRILNSSNH